jgi:hypothetical protein
MKASAFKLGHWVGAWGLSCGLAKEARGFFEFFEFFDTLYDFERGGAVCAFAQHSRIASGGLTRRVYGSCATDVDCGRHAWFFEAEWVIDGCWSFSSFSIAFFVSG